MNDMIGGQDVIFEVDKRSFNFLRVIGAVADFWPDAVIQDADGDAFIPLEELQREQSEGWSEFFVYRNMDAAKRWESEGCTPVNDRDMVHFLIETDQTETVRLTIVVGEMSGEALQIVASISEALKDGSDLGNGNQVIPHRVDWDRELKAAGYTQGRDAFYEQVEALRGAHFPEWSADELACHPREALQFCNTIRQLAGPIPDYLVMKALMNRRRQGGSAKKDSEPRLIWGK
jgi:hypothetical protein